MVVMKEKTSMRVGVKAVCPTVSRTECQSRDVSFTIDEPEIIGGSNLGPTPVETLLSSLAGCTNVILNRVADMHEVKISDLQTDVNATFFRRGATLQEEIEKPIEDIKLLIRFTSEATQPQIISLKSDLSKYCPISKVLRGAGISIDETWEVNAP